jgi:hypothetical protein
VGSGAFSKYFRIYGYCSYWTKAEDRWQEAYRQKLIAIEKKRQLEEAKRVMEPAGPLYNRLDKVLAAATGGLMRYLRLVLIAVVFFGACSCSEVAGGLGGNLSKPEQIRCQAGPDCDLKWERAYKWVVENSGLKLKTKTDGLIKTEADRSDRTLVVIITKNPTPQSGTYEIDFIGKCPSVLSCVPSAAESRTRFANFVLTAG